MRTKDRKPLHGKDRSAPSSGPLLSALSVRLKEHRAAISDVLGVRFRQDHAARQIGVSLPTYVKAETYGIFGPKSLWKYQKWLATAPPSLARRAKRDRLMTAAA